MVLQTILGEGYTVIEEGQNGRTIATEDPAEGEKNGLRYLGPCLESHSPLDLVIIMLGSNDCKRKFAYSAMDIAGEMQILLEKAVSYNHFRCGDRFRILLVSPPHIAPEIRDSWLGDSFGFENAVKVSKELTDWYKSLAGMYGCEYLDATEYVKASEVDGVHLDAEGQMKLGTVIAECIKRR
jgi:lysophospholipase L1-like esterase